METLQEVIYSEGQVESIALSMGIAVVGDTRHDLLCMCPYHDNNVTPSFSLSKTSGRFICFNHSCGQKGSLIKLVSDIKRVNEFQAQRLIAKYKTDSVDLSEAIKRRLDKADEFPVFRQEVIDRMHSDLLKNSTAIKYLSSRGLNRETAERFELGYSEQRTDSGLLRLVAVPMHDEYGNPVGVIGRSVDQKKFKNSFRLPSSRTLFNIHRAKRSSRVVIVESSFDAMLLEQLGHPAVAILSGALSDEHFDQLIKYFGHVIIMADDDDIQHYANCRKCDGNCQGHNPGRALGLDIQNRLLDSGSGVRVQWACGKNPTAYKIYDRGVKDPGEMSHSEIDYAIRNARSAVEFGLRTAR